MKKALINKSFYLTIILVCLLFNNKLSAQKNNFPIDSTTNLVSYKKTITLTNSKKNLFNNIKLWLSKTFEDYKWKSVYEDVESGRIVLGGESKFNSDLINTLKVNTTIEYKDNSYRYTITDVKIGFSSATSIDYVDLESIVSAYNIGKKKHLDLIMKSIDATNKMEKDLIKRQEKEVLQKNLLAQESLNLIDAKINRLINSLESDLSVTF